MCVPAHDDRDFAFATKFGLPIIQVISQDGKEIENMTEAYCAPSGVLINSGDWNGMEVRSPEKRSSGYHREDGDWTQDGQLQTA